MDRRGFLTTTFSGGLAVTGSACATGRPDQGAHTSEVPLADDELDRKLARLDTTLERMNHKHTTRWFHEQRLAAGAPPPTEADRERLTHEGELVRASLRSALLLSSVAELPEANRSDPRVTARLDQIAGEADYALLGTLAKLRSLDASELEALDSEFASVSAGVGMDVAERIDELSHKLDVPAGRRLHLRRMAKHLDWRLERERFSSVVGEVVGEVERAVEAIAHSLATAGSGGAAVAFAGPDPSASRSWVERTREVVRFYSPAGVPADAPAGEPVGQPTAAPVMPAAASAEPATVPAPQPQPVSPPTYTQADMAAWELEQQRYREQRAVERAKTERDQHAGVIMAGTGAGLLVLGGAGLAVGIPFIAATAAIVSVSLGGIGITAGVILLIVGIVLAVRAKKKLAAP